MKKLLLWIVGAIVLIVVIAAAASGGKSSSGTTSSPALVTSASTPTPTTPPKPPARPQVFRGAGDENLGTIAVSTPSTLRWSCASCSVFGADGLDSTGQAISIAVTGRTGGVTAVEPGTYKSVTVTVDEGLEHGSGWTIHITPGQ